MAGLHVSGEYPCKCGAFKKFEDDFALPDPPFEIKCDECGTVLISSGIEENQDNKDNQNGQDNKDSQNGQGDKDNQDNQNEQNAQNK